MDISKRRFKITERVGKQFVVYVEVPKYKRRWWLFGKPYYDDNDLTWAVVTMAGQPMFKGDKEQPAVFKSITAAREFVADCKVEKRETFL